MSRLQNYVEKYGPEVGPKFYSLIQSRSARVGVSARLRRKIEAIAGQKAAHVSPAREETALLPMFVEAGRSAEPGPIAGAPAVG